MISPRETSTNPYEAPQTRDQDQVQYQETTHSVLGFLRSAVLYILFAFLILRVISRVLVFFLEQR